MGVGRLLANPGASLSDAAYRLEVFSGAISSTRADIYVRCAALPGGGPFRITGLVHGPYCLFSRTLPARIPLMDQGPGPTVLARATVPDPCVWSPELPMIYQVEWTLWDASTPFLSRQEIFGLRGLGCHQRSVYRENRRTVLRGVEPQLPIDPADAQWRELMLSCAVWNPDDALCLDASRHGLALVAHVATSNTTDSDVTRLARWPAVQVITLDAPGLSQEPPRARAQLPLIAQRVLNVADVCRSWETTLWVRLQDPTQDIPTIAAQAGPVMVARTTTATELGDVRRACEQLQRDLAPELNLAGYFVVHE